MVRVETDVPELIPWGDWGWAARLTITYAHPRTSIAATIEELVRIPRHDAFTLRVGAGVQVPVLGHHAEQAAAPSRPRRLAHPLGPHRAA